MQTSYYIIESGVPAGPFTASELQLRGIATDTPVWIDERSEWIEAGRVDELQRIFITPAVESEAEAEAEAESPHPAEPAAQYAPTPPPPVPATEGKAPTPHSRFAIAVSAILATILIATAIRIAGTAVLSAML